MMKKIFLSLLAPLFLCSCSNTPGDQYCKYLEEATERMEKATSMKEVTAINKRLINNIITYSQNIETEDYKKWEQDSIAQKELTAAQQKYTDAKSTKIKALKKK